MKDVWAGANWRSWGWSDPPALWSAYAETSILMWSADITRRKEKKPWQQVLPESGRQLAWMTSGDIKLQYTASLFVWLQQHWNAWIITNMASLSEVCISLSVAYIALDNCIKTSLWGGCQSVGSDCQVLCGPSDPDHWCERRWTRPRWCTGWCSD